MIKLSNSIIYLSMTISTQPTQENGKTNSKFKKTAFIITFINLSIQPGFSFSSLTYFQVLLPLALACWLLHSTGAESGRSHWRAVIMAWTCLLGHTSLGLQMKDLCANTCEGTGQVKLVVLKNITLPGALPLLTLHIRVLKIASQSSCWQRLMMRFYGYI